MPALADLHRQFLTLLPRNYWLLRSVVDRRLEPMGLSSAQWRPLLVLNDAPEPLTQVQLARTLGLEAPTVVRLLDRLVDKGWAQRRNCPHDRRAYRVELTATGKALCAKFEPLLAEMRRDVLGGLSAAELTQAVALMERLNERLTGLDAGEHSVAGKDSGVELRTESSGPSNRMRAVTQARRTRTSR
jgi:MarR family transcriptional regulator, transcriptional regulator for hemolysin